MLSGVRRALTQRRKTISKRSRYITSDGVEFVKRSELRRVLIEHDRVSTALLADIEGDTPRLVVVTPEDVQEELGDG